MKITVEKEFHDLKCPGQAVKLKCRHLPVPFLLASAIIRCYHVKYESKTPENIDSHFLRPGERQYGMGQDRRAFHRPRLPSGRRRGVKRHL